MAQPVNSYNAFSILGNDAMFEQLSESLQNEEKTIKITASYDEAQCIAKQYRLEGYNTNIVNYGNSFHINIKPQVKVDLQSAIKSGQFKKLAFGKYAFTKDANNALGFKHYNFDDGTIWKTQKAKDGKEYLVKEIDDDNEDKVIRSKVNDSKPLVLASSNTNVKQLVRLAKVLYDNPSEEFINDLLKVSSNFLSNVLMTKLNKVINNELDAINISSPYFRNQARQKVAMAIDSNTLFHKEQISKIIRDLNKIDLTALQDVN